MMSRVGNFTKTLILRKIHLHYVPTTRYQIRYESVLAQPEPLPSEQLDYSNIKNEPVLQYTPGSEELELLQEAIKKTLGKCEEIPIVVDGKEIISDRENWQYIPHRHAHKLAKYYHADEKTLKKAIRVAVDAQEKWDQTPIAERVKIWERAAELMSKQYRADLLAATMLGQSKTVMQAEIDAGTELTDFIRMSAKYLQRLSSYEPISEFPNVTKNHYRMRGLEGFVASICPFNFTAIGANLAYTPALVGCGVLWKPADSAMLASWRVFSIMREAGVPNGLVNFVPSNGNTFGNMITYSEHLAAINYTGSLKIFKKLWKFVAQNLDYYRNFPRLIGECGGKNFHFVHASANVDTVVAATIRSAFEYSGQKCSACSRLFVPESKWESKIKQALCEKTSQLQVGDVCNFKNFLSAVIDETAFKRITEYIEYAKKERATCKIIVGGNYSNLRGHFIMPTIIEVINPEDRLLKDEIFGPILSVYVYKDKDVDKAIKSISSLTPYALTGAVFAEDENFLKYALQKFKYAAGNFYVNDKCTGAVVGQQPFGGARMSGTNDKAGGPHYLLRFTSPQAIKETFVPSAAIEYPYMK